MLVVEPLQLFRPKHRAGLVYALQRKKLRQLRKRIQLPLPSLPAGRQAGVPTQERQVVNERLGEVALRFVLVDRHRTVALGHLCFIGGKDKRDVHILWPDKPQRLLYQYLPLRVRNVVLAADDVRNSHVVVVDSHRQVVQRIVDIARDDKVAKLGGVKSYLAAYCVVEGYFFVRVFKPDNLFIRVFCLRFGLIRVAVCNEFWNIFLINFRALRLSRILGKGVWNAEPMQTVHNILFELRLVALFVRILEAQHHFPAVVRGKKIVKNSRPHRPDMQKARRARRKPRNNFHTTHYCSWETAMSRRAEAISFAASARAKARAALAIACTTPSWLKILFISEASKPGVRLFCSITTQAPALAYVYAFLV